MILRKIINFLDFIIEWVAKPVDFIASFAIREPKSFLDVVLCFFCCTFGLPICVVLGLLCTVLSVVRLIIGGDIDESQENNSNV